MSLNVIIKAFFWQFLEFQDQQVSDGRNIVIYFSVEYFTTCGECPAEGLLGENNL